jgi:hypothetical protein
VIRIHASKPGRAPLVEHRWYPTNRDLDAHVSGT